MTRRSLALLMLVAVLGFAGGCASGPGSIAARTQRTIALDGKSKRTTIATKVAEELTLQLPRTDGTPGFHWRLVFHDPRTLQQKNEITPAPAADGYPSITFVAQRAVNRTVLRFLLVPEASSREAEPADSHEVTITVQP